MKFLPEIDYAVINGYLQGLKDFIAISAKQDLRDICKHIAWIGRLDFLIYAHENGCSWDVMTCADAASEGHLDCLKYVHGIGRHGCLCLFVYEWLQMY